MLLTHGVMLRLPADVAQRQMVAQQQPFNRFASIYGCCAPLWSCERAEDARAGKDDGASRKPLRLRKPQKSQNYKIYKF